MGFDSIFFTFLGIFQIVGHFVHSLFALLNKIIELLMQLIGLFALNQGPKKRLIEFGSNIKGLIQKEHHQYNPEQIKNSSIKHHPDKRLTLQYQRIQNPINKIFPQSLRILILKHHQSKIGRDKETYEPYENV